MAVCFVALRGEVLVEAMAKLCHLLFHLPDEGSRQARHLSVRRVHIALPVAERWQLKGKRRCERWLGPATLLAYWRRQSLFSGPAQVQPLGDCVRADAGELCPLAYRARHAVEFDQAHRTTLTFREIVCGWHGKVNLRAVTSSSGPKRASCRRDGESCDRRNPRRDRSHTHRIGSLAAPRTPCSRGATYCHSRDRWRWAGACPPLPCA